MYSSDLEFLLQPISTDSACGDDLSYDPAFLALEEAIRGKPESQIGDTVVPAEEPNWRDVRKQSVELLKRTRDLRVLVWLTTAELELRGLRGAADGFAAIVLHVDQFWTPVHPKLDPDDNNDPTMRVNILAALSPAQSAPDSLRFTDRLLNAPLCKSRQLGVVTQRDIYLATGELKPVGAQVVREAAAIDAAFGDSPLEDLQALSASVAAIRENLGQIDTRLTEHVGASKAANFEALKKIVTAIIRSLENQLSRRGAQGAASTTNPATGETGAEAASAGAMASGPLRTRQDALVMLEKVCTYFDTFEPSSPVQLVLRRASRLANMSFMDIIRDLAADAESQVRIATGAREEEGKSE